MTREPGLTLRVRLTLSYAGFVVLTGSLLLVAAWAFLHRYVPEHALIAAPDGAVPARTGVLRAFLPVAAWTAALLLVIGLGGGWLLAGRMLAPLDRITAATRLAATGSLQHRIRLPGRDDELAELADAFDAMLDRLEAHVAEQRRFAANASHELRTPLATTRAMLDVARSDPDHAPADLLDRLHAVNVRAIELTEALLLLSRADQRAFASEHVDLSLLAEEAAETLLPLAERRGITLDVAGEVAPVVGAGSLLLQLVTNLVHNAVVHNLPEGGTVEVRTTLRPATAAGRGTAALTVQNTGERLDPRVVATLTEPFRRGTDRVHRDQAGVGLGLAIVARIVRAHDGRLSVSALPAGGLRVAVQLPAAPVTTPRSA